MLQFATSMLQNIILKFEKTKKLFKKQTFEMDWFIGLLEKLYLASVIVFLSLLAVKS